MQNSVTRRTGGKTWDPKNNTFIEKIENVSSINSPQLQSIVIHHCMEQKKPDRERGTWRIHLWLPFAGCGLTDTFRHPHEFWTRKSCLELKDMKFFHHSATKKGAHASFWGLLKPLSLRRWAKILFLILLICCIRPLNQPNQELRWPQNTRIE